MNRADVCNSMDWWTFKYCMLNFQIFHTEKKHYCHVVDIPKAYFTSDAKCSKFWTSFIAAGMIITELLAKKHTLWP